MSMPSAPSRILPRCPVRRFHRSSPGGTAGSDRRDPALGLRGGTEARQTLLRELSHSPSSEIFEAIATVRDDDVIVHLGRCAHRHPPLASAVLEALHDIGSRRTLSVAGNLKVATSD
ncbi:MAG: hypothetical protein J4G15_10455 [Alphaproteobacteria bacterium]|nr:hypothetical protein [Alphaproteobacteria bacterium]